MSLSLVSLVSPVLLVVLLAALRSSEGQRYYENLQLANPNGFYPAPPPGQFQYLYTPPISGNPISSNVNSNVNTRNQQVNVNTRRNNVKNVNKKNAEKKRNQVPKKKINTRVNTNNNKTVNYTYIPIELLSALITNDISKEPLEPLPFVITSNSTPNRNQNVQLGSGVYIRVPLRFNVRNQTSEANDNTEEEEGDDEDQVQAIADNEIIPMEMFEEMLYVDTEMRRFNTTSPVYNSPEGVRVTLNNLLRLFAPPASLFRRAGTNFHEQDNLFMRLLRERYQLSSGNNIFNRNLNRN